MHFPTNVSSPSKAVTSSTKKPSDWPNYAYSKMPAIGEDRKVEDQSESRSAGQTFVRSDLKTLPIGQHQYSPDYNNLSFTDDNYMAQQSAGARHRILVNSYSSDDPRRWDAVSVGRRTESTGLSASDTGSIGAQSPSTTGIGSVPSGSTTDHSPSETSLSKKQDRPREGPSSRRTVLIIACFFVVGLMFVLSGVIVLYTEQHYAFRITGSLFVMIGSILFVSGLFLQQKNVKKFMQDMQHDLYFLNFRENSKLLRSFFSFDNQSKSNQSGNA